MYGLTRRVTVCCKVDRNPQQNNHYPDNEPFQINVCTPDIMYCLFRLKKAKYLSSFIKNNYATNQDDFPLGWRRTAEIGYPAKGQTGRNDPCYDPFKNSDKKYGASWFVQSAVSSMRASGLRSDLSDSRRVLALNNKYGSTAHCSLTIMDNGFIVCSKSQYKKASNLAEDYLANNQQPGPDWANELTLDSNGGVWSTWDSHPYITGFMTEAGVLWAIELNKDRKPLEVYCVVLSKQDGFLGVLCKV